MDELAKLRLRRALVQKLDSWQQAGVLQLRRSAAGPQAAAGTEPDEEQTMTPQPADEGAKPAAERQATIFDQPSERAAALPVAKRREALAALQREVAGCTRCRELARTRTQTVFGVGNPAPRLCFVGEAPGADEDRQGEPFVGRAGQLLTRIIEACTLKREDVYILNILKCRPPGNRNPTAIEADNCSSFLHRQLDILQPELICCLGSVAATNLLQTTQSIGRLRGKFYLYRGIKVLVTYHPAYLLRNPSAKRQVWEDMKLVMKELGIPIPEKYA